MKLTRTEKIWLALAAVFYLLYNIPGVPAYGDSVGTLVHAALTIIPLWIVVYVGTAKVYRIYRVRDDSPELADGFDAASFWAAAEQTVQLAEISLVAHEARNATDLDLDPKGGNRA